MFKILELPEGFAPLAPLPGLCPGHTWGLKRPPDPSPNNFAPPFLIPGYGPERNVMQFPILVDPSLLIISIYLACLILHGTYMATPLH